MENIICRVMFSATATKLIHFALTIAEAKAEPSPENLQYVCAGGLTYVCAGGLDILNFDKNS